VPVPVELDVALARRPAPGVEAAVYFACAEALTNVARYAQAQAARVTVREAGGALELEVADDGVGGADRAAGSGLRGLEDRIGAVDGALVVDSPPGGGTRIRVRIPLEEDAP
jgi:signal transduction histidine kinase